LQWFRHHRLSKILLIAPYSFGYTQYIYEAIAKYDSVSAEIIYLDVPTFSYKNFFHHLQNVISKIFFGKNLKKTLGANRIKNQIQVLGKQDLIFIIRPDALDNTTLTFLKNATQKLDAYYWDSTRRFPRMAKIIPFFDTIYSYDKEDVARYDLKFLTNYIFHSEVKSPKTKYQFFNISTVDYRLPLLEKTTEYISSKGWTHRIFVYNRSPIETKHVKLLTTQKNVKESLQLMAACDIVVEIQREEQTGLSFRAFEAMGLEKKLITTNKDIVNYDFYHPQNILVLDLEDIQIPDDFVTSPYLSVDEKILSKYRLENWVKPVFKIASARCFF
jgi:hypothetical protein